MCISHDLQNSHHRLLHERWREWLPGLLGFFSLVGIATLARFADRHNWWFRDQYELLSLIIFAAGFGSICIGWITLLRITQRSLPSKAWPRIMSTLFFVVMGFKVGGRYAHMCMTGSPFIEGFAILGTPALVGIILFAYKGRVRGYLIATSLLVIVWFLARPYLDWAHGS